MININFQNIEKIILYDKKIRKLLPDLENQFKQWDISQYPGLKSLAKRTVLNILNSINDAHVEILKDHFKDEVCIVKIDHEIVRHASFDLNSASEEINDASDWFGQAVAYRNRDNLYVTFWR